ncbi:hypothetical protein EES37_34690 [Streptomyces sp. ADI91-18]|uniref:lamin tail domain-containing protein n=1 Tax=Streptomyces sp. ADI91-18 TaxID=1522755 RepID=UPI000F99D12C|nr:lamin tail domain-containing protein [Streptomyces sp. ADI91-18]RPK29376.1 hypothetical protein EES37_34690 [Streptomyces sp. ADI91-18]
MPASGGRGCESRGFSRSEGPSTGTRDAIILRGWTLRDADGNRYRFDNVRINGRATIRIHTGSGHNTRIDLFQNGREYIWGNNGDTATLRDDRGRTVDTETWGRRR